DVMDGHFVPNLAFSIDFIRALRKVTEKVLDVHLMVIDPERYVEKFASCGDDRLSVHEEATHTPIRLLEEIRKRGMKAGMVLNPATGVDTLQYLWEHLDYVLLMGVEPGFAGQTFIPAILDKISKVASIRKERSLKLEIEVDGGISWTNARACVERGADVLIAGALCIFDGRYPLIEGCKQFRRIIEGEV
ncbi:MAG: ribulose-phosphate 3-epimerase, partial [Spirochaetes bacterium]|nr:ribulose-phosphate 3-epimerase [Spirochaetota bacterium]